MGLNAYIRASQPFRSAFTKQFQRSISAYQMHQPKYIAFRTPIYNLSPITNSIAPMLLIKSPGSLISLALMCQDGRLCGENGDDEEGISPITRLSPICTV